MSLSFHSFITPSLGMFPCLTLFTYASFTKRQLIVCDNGTKPTNPKAVQFKGIFKEGKSIMSGNSNGVRDWSLLMPGTGAEGI